MSASIPPPSQFELPTVPPPKPKSRLALWIVAAIVGFGGCLCLPILAAILFPVFAQARQAALLTACKQNITNVGLAVVAYTDDHKDKLPAEQGWQDAVRPYAPEGEGLSYQCPVLKTPSFGNGYQLNPKLAGMTLDQARKSKEPLLIEVPVSDTDGGRHHMGSRYTVYYIDRGAVAEGSD